MRIREGLVESEGHRLAFLAVDEHLARPDEPAVVFVHGVLASVNFWRGCVPPSFTEGRAWYALSLPAHHPSTVPEGFSLHDVNADWFFRVMHGGLEALLGGRKAVVVGHSTGGFVGLLLASGQAPSVAGVVSVAGFHSGRWGGVEGLLVKLAGLGPWARPLFEPNIRVAGLSRLVQREFAAQLAHDAGAFRASPLSERMLDDLRANTRGQDPTALFHLFHGIRHLEIADRLGGIQVPCHVFASTHDPVVPPEQSLLIASRVPHARTTVFRDVGHMPFMEATHAWYRALDQALRDIDPRLAGPEPPTASPGGEPMSYPEFRADLQHIHESEVYGLAVFGTAAKVTRDPARRAKWLALKALEQQTLDRYLAYMRATGRPVKPPRAWALRGRVEGAALGAMPWAVAMKLVADATQPFMARFQRLEAHAQGADREFFSYVVAHEQALESFARLERAGQPGSLDAVEALLGR